MSGISSISLQKEKRKMRSMMLETIMCHTNKLKQAAMPCHACNAILLNQLNSKKQQAQNIKR